MKIKDVQYVNTAQKHKLVKFEDEELDMLNNNIEFLKSKSVSE